MEVSGQPWLLYHQENNHNIHWIGGWVSPKAGLDPVEKRTILPLLAIEPQPVQPIAHHYTDCAIPIYMCIIYTHTNPHTYMNTHIYKNPILSNRF
jgi:hypothetical protein